MMMMRDPRVMQIVLLGLYTIIGLSFLQFELTVPKLILTLGTCIILEWFFLYAKHGKITFPYSAVITALGIALVLRSDTVLPYIMASIVAIGLKHVLRYRGDHIFNPSNSGIAAISVLFPLAVATDPLQWGYYLWVLVVMSLGGLYLVYKVHRLPLVLSFFFSFVTIQWIRYLIWPDVWNSHFSTFMWGGLFIFTFNMITDPKTSPKKTVDQIGFGLTIALVAQSLIHMNVHGALFISLAIICLGKFLWQWVQDRELLKRHSSV